MYQEKFKYRRSQFAEKFQALIGSEPSTKAETDRIIKVRGLEFSNHMRCTPTKQGTSCTGLL